MGIFGPSKEKEAPIASSFPTLERKEYTLGGDELKSDPNKPLTQKLKNSWPSRDGLTSRLQAPQKPETERAAKVACDGLLDGTWTKQTDAARACGISSYSVAVYAAKNKIDLPISKRGPKIIRTENMDMHGRVRVGGAIRTREETHALLSKVYEEHVNNQIPPGMLTRRLGRDGFGTVTYRLWLKRNRKFTSVAPLMGKGKADELPKRYEKLEVRSEIKPEKKIQSNDSELSVDIRDGDLDIKLTGSDERIISFIKKLRN